MRGIQQEWPLLYLLTARLTQQFPKHMRHPQRMPIDRKGALLAGQRTCERAVELLQGGAAGWTAFDLGQAQDAPRLEDAHAFFEQGRPARPVQHAHQEAPVDQIKAVVVEAQGLTQISDLKVGVVQILRSGVHAGRGNHLSADIDAPDLHVAMTKRQLLRPFARSAGQIEHPFHVLKLPLGQFGQQPTQDPRQELLLLD